MLSLYCLSQGNKSILPTAEQKHTAGGLKVFNVEQHSRDAEIMDGNEF